MKNKNLKIIAGPCSIDEHNLSEVYDMANFEANGKKVLFGTRIIGLKSRTSLDKSGKGMGIDFKILMENLRILEDGGSVEDLRPTPSMEIAAKVTKDTGLLIAFEVMMPLVQLLPMERIFPKGKALIWNPSVNQLGWPLMQMARIAARNEWYVGIKNGKWLGDKEERARSDDMSLQLPIEKVWEGLVDYSGDNADRIALIHRGFEVPDKGNYRAPAVHEIAKRTKKRIGRELFFDPSHSLGPEMRDQIVEGTIKAMKMKLDEENYLYDGVLIEVGTSTTDTEQHITVAEYKGMVRDLSTFRDLSV